MKQRAAFFAGVISALLVLALGTTALAASGQITFRFANVALNGETKIAAGSDLTAPNGQKVPGSILYVDEAGGKTNYLPIRAISELLGVNIEYDSATKTVNLITKQWQRTVEGRMVSYSCGQEGHTYDAPPAFRPVWTEEGWSLAALQHDTRNYTAGWTYENGQQKLNFRCAYPSTAGFGRQMSSAEVIDARQLVTVQGETAEYYEDGDTSLLVWENAEGVLFFLRGDHVTRETLLAAAESVRPAAEAAPTATLGRTPAGSWLMDHYAVADTVMEYWVYRDTAFTWTCSASPLAMPAGDGEAVELGETEARFWTAEEPYVPSSSTITIGGQVMERVPGLTSVTIPSARTMNTLAWQDGETGLFCRLQSVLDRDAMLAMAESAG